MLPPWMIICGVFLLGLALGALANWAIYQLAWTTRAISPWGPLPEGVDRRKPLDRLPVVGWLGLRREHALHGRWFWLRPLLVELFFAVGLVALYQWEIESRGLVMGQLNAFLPPPVSKIPAGLIPRSLLWQPFLSHCLLLTLMVAASFIDLDEKIIPDEITVPGTLVGLLLATLLPMSLLPQAYFPNPQFMPVWGAQIPLNQQGPGFMAFLEPLWLTAPNFWLAEFDGFSNVFSLVLAQFCWWLWCFALTPRFFRGRRGVCRGLAVLGRRVVRELLRPPIAVIAWPGAVAVTATWWWGGEHWAGLLTSLVGMAASGSLIWSVRVVGSAALGREAMGFGDVTLMMMVGTFVGWQSGILIFFLAPFAGLLAGILQLILKSDDVIPYGPFLCLGTLAVIVCWAEVWNRTQAFFSIGWLVPAVLVVSMFLLGALLLAWQALKVRILGMGD